MFYGAHEDRGFRCPRHGLEVFMPKCNACGSLNREAGQLHLTTEQRNH